MVQVLEVLSLIMAVMLLEEEVGMVMEDQLSTILQEVYLLLMEGMEV